MLAGTNAYRGLMSAEKIEDSDVVRTVEGLRGRLVAERAISKAANDDALLMRNMVMELENKLKEETKSKRRAEKKLKVLVKKLESLKTNYWADAGGHSSTSSSSSGVIVKVPEEIQQLSSSVNSDLEQDPKHIVADAINTEQNDSSGSSKDDDMLSATTVGTTTSTTNSPDSISDQMLGSSVEVKGDVQQSLKSSSEEGGDDVVDSSMALVLVPASSLQMASMDRPEMVMSGRSVSEVLDALRHSREQIQWALERRHVLTAGSINTRIC